jgi:hypothetical protein
VVGVNVGVVNRALLRGIDSQRQAGQSRNFCDFGYVFKTQPLITYQRAGSPHRSQSIDAPFASQPEMIGNAMFFLSVAGKVQAIGARV